MAALDISDLDDWSSSISRNAKTPRTVSMGAKLVGENTNADKLLALMSQPAFFEDILKDFIEKELLGTSGIFYQEFYAKAKSGPEYFPQYIPKGEKKASYVGRRHHDTDSELAEDQAREADYNVNMGKTGTDRTMAGGFAALWNIIRRPPVMRVSDHSVTAGIGKMSDLMALKLGRFSGGRAAPSQFDSLFYAVEYGTGVKENVGGERWVRRDGKSKARSPKPPGSWYFNPSEDEDDDALYLGQRGVHFLYDARTRKPRDVYDKRIRERLPQAISARLSNGIKAKFF